MHTTPVIALTTAALLASTGWAQDAQQQIVTELSRPAAIQVAPQDGQQSQIRSSTTYTQSGNGNVVTIQINDGRTSGTINGNPIPPDRISKEAGQIVVVDEQGEAVARFMVSASPAIPVVIQRQRIGEPMVFRGQASAQGGIAPPPVMLGVTMEEPSESLRYHFGLAEGEGIAIAATTEGLPASNAGLQKGDIIVGLAGKSPATRALLVEHLRTMKPGDTLELKVIQKGVERAVSVVVAAYEPQALQFEVQAQARGEGGVPFGMTFRDALSGAVGQGAAGLNPERFNAMAEQLNQLLQEQGGMLEQHKETIQRYFEQLAEKAGEQAQQLWIERAPQFENQLNRFFVQRGQDFPAGVPVPSAPQGQLPAEARVKIEQMQTDLERQLKDMELQMQQRLERLERNLDRLIASQSER